VPDPPGTGDAAQLGDDIVRREAGGLVDDDEPAGFLVLLRTSSSDAFARARRSSIVLAFSGRASATKLRLGVCFTPAAAPTAVRSTPFALSSPAAADFRSSSSP
jgi:hypothetical protein